MSSEQAITLTEKPLSSFNLFLEKTTRTRCRLKNSVRNADKWYELYYGYRENCRNISDRTVSIQLDSR